MKEIDYFFGIGSPWAWLALDPFLAIAARHNLRIRPVPVPLITENGGVYSRDRPEPRRAYWLRDLERWAKLRGKALRLENRQQLADPTPANFTLLAAISAGDSPDGQEPQWVTLTRLLQDAFWQEAADIGDATTRKHLLQQAGFDAEALETRAAGRDIQALWQKGRDEAQAAGVFGLPTFRYERELYWGQDSLPFLERHLAGAPL